MIYSSQLIGLTPPDSFKREAPYCAAGSCTFDGDHDSGFQYSDLMDQTFRTVLTGGEFNDSFPIYRPGKKRLSEEEGQASARSVMSPSLPRESFMVGFLNKGYYV
jgi:hypothetical protein